VRFSIVFCLLGGLISMLYEPTSLFELPAIRGARTGALAMAQAGATRAVPQLAATMPGSTPAPVMWEEDDDEEDEDDDDDFLGDDDDLEFDEEEEPVEEGEDTAGDDEEFDFDDEDEEDEEDPA